MSVMSDNDHQHRPAHGVPQVLTCDACPVAELEGIPDHWPVGDGQKSLGVLIGVCRVRGQRRPRPTENKSLQAR